MLKTHEIGSLAKPAWRVRGCRGQTLTDEEINDARRWGAKLGVENVQDLLTVFKMEDSEQKRQEILEWSAIYGIRFLEKAGLDIVFDGEQWRSEMYDHFMNKVEGITPLGNVRSFDNKYYRKAAVTGRIAYREPIYLDEFLFSKKHARRPLKVPFTGAYTLADWSFNEFYWSRHKGKDLSRLKKEAKRDFVLDMASRVIRPEIRNLVEAGAEWVQIDEPAAATQPDEIDLFVESFNESVKGIACKFGVHICFSDYKLLFPSIMEMEKCDQFAWEFANRDGRSLGLEPERRPGYEALKLFNEYNDRREIGLGVTDIHVDYVEPAELVRDRILYAAKVLGDPERIYVNPDCGLRTRSWEVALSKLENMVAGTKLAREEL